MTTKFQKIGLPTAISILMLFSGSNAFAAPGILADTPLFVSTAVEPNIFLTLDDSGSMSWETMVQDQTAGFDTSGGRPIVGSYTVEFYNTEWHTDCNVMPPDSVDDEAWVFRNHHGNKNYYNPATTYTPWVGYDDADETAVREYPYTSTNTGTPNLTRTTDITQRYTYYDYTANGDCDNSTAIADAYYIPTYTVWKDDGDGILEVDDDYDIVEIAAGTDEMQNFANWFEFYRKREYSAKAAIGRVINNTTGTRMGLDVFNRGHQEDIKSMTDQTNKNNLLTSFYQIWSQNGTPAHESLKRVGDRFMRTSGTRPILGATDGGECQQNFNILLSDGFWNSYVNPGVGNADESSTGGEIDDSITPNKGFDGNASESNDKGNYEDSWSNTLADLAMYFYETDLRDDLADKVPTKDNVDSADHQHLVTYTIGFGLTGTLDPADKDPVEDAPTTGDFWPNPMDTEDEERVDDLWHAAYNSRGLFLSAQNPDELQASLNAAIEDIAGRVATSSAVSVTAAELTTEAVVYVSEFNSSPWQGTIFAYPIVENTDTGALELAASYSWSTAAVLDAQDADSRVILTMDDDFAGGSDGVPFRWEDTTTGGQDTLTDAMKADLRTNSIGGTDSDEIAMARAAYIRGDRSNENGGFEFRSRATVLGDIIHSGPVYVAEPNLRWPDEAPFPTDGESYSTFKTQQADRDGMIYVGANDGMLHGFDASNGKEVLAYIPSNLFSTESGRGLHYLTHQNYAHQYYNDLTPTVSDVYLPTGSGGSDWRSILIGGQRAGGRGYFALDITNTSYSEATAANTVMWEFTSDDDADLGYTFSRPQIGMTNDNEWVAIFGNGYNSTGDGAAKLFIVKISAGEDGTWDTGDYYKLSTGVGASDDLNGLATPSLADLDGNGTIDRAYAGDLKGNMWAFDLSNPSQWAIATTNLSKKLFTTNPARPITSKPSLSFHPTQTTDNTNEPNIMVTFGTGQYMVETDRNSTDDNYFYGVWDDGSTNLGPDNLVGQSYRNGFNVGGESARVLTQNSVDYENKHGWYIPLPDNGERVVTNSIIRSGFVFFNTSVPSLSPCSTSGGYGYRFIVDLATGGTPDEPVVDVNNDGVVDGNDTVDESNSVVASSTRFNRQLTDDNLTQDHILNERDITAVQDAPKRPTGRISWQELLK